MRFLILLPIFPPHLYGGAEISAINLAHWLARQGHEVGIVTSAGKDEAETSGTTENGLKIWRRHFPRPYPFWDHARAPKWQKPLWYLQDHFDPRNARILGRILDEFCPDCVDIQALRGIGYNALSAVARRGIPSVYHVHDLEMACLWGGMFKDGKTCTKQCVKCKTIGHVRFGTLKKIPRLAICSPSRANLALLRNHADLSRMITAAIMNANAYPTPRVETCSPETPHLLFVGRIHETKGICFLLKVLDDLSKQVDFVFNILGDGPSLAEMKKLYREKTWIHFRGHVSEQEVSDFMATSSLLCLPSLWHENSPGVAIQALSLGLPVIGSNIGGIPELVKHKFNGLLVQAGNAAAWHEALTCSLRDPALLDAWRKNAQEDSSRFEQDNLGRAYLAVVERAQGTAL